jgi:uncharacterized protein YndB with AHSA1/START domain
LNLDRRFAALAHPLRRDMLARLAGGPHTISELAARADMTFAAVSKHLRVLEEAGLVSRRIEGREHRFAGRPRALGPAGDWIAEHTGRWQQSLNRMKAVMEEEMAQSLSAMAEVFVAAPPERVFKGWCDPAIAGKFLCVGDPTLGECRLDPRVGGEIFVVMADKTMRILHRGEFLVVDPPRRLMFTWLSQPTGLRLTVVTVTFAAERGGTRVSLVHEGFVEADVTQSHAGGWTGILGNLAAALG